MFNGIDLSSDTATKPTPAMKKAMIAAELGDEQKNEDPTTKRLEEVIAKMLNFDQAIFLPSATMANQIAISALCEPGDELFAAENCHLFHSESGGPAIHARVMCKAINTNTGVFTAEDIRKKYHSIRSVRNAMPKLIAVENTTNLGGGVAWKKEELISIVQCARELKLKLHMDGARLFNASVKTKLSPAEIVCGFDTVTICLTKGLGCPVGAVLAFSNDSFDKVQRLKHLMGGAMRQAGILAAAGIYALEKHITRLQEDHEHAAQLANLLNKQSQRLRVINYPPETNIVFFEWTGKAVSADQFHNDSIRKGVRFSRVSDNRFRAVTHLGITAEDIIKTIQIVESIGTS